MLRVTRFAAILALLAIFSQLLLPFAHAAAMDAGVTLAWCGTGKAPSLDSSSEGKQGDAKLLIKCPMCSVASLHAIAPALAGLSLPLLVLTSTAPSVASKPVFVFQSYAIPPPPRGPPHYS